MLFWRTYMASPQATCSPEAFLEIVYSRRSIRKYLDKDVPDELLEKILEAARWAPSGENAQPWRFIIIRDKKKREILGEIAGNASARRFRAEYLSGRMQQRLKDFKSEESRQRVYRKLLTGEVSRFIKDAPVLIAVVGKLDAWDTPYDTSAAIENMLLAAHALGLGACWVVAANTDIRDEVKVKELLKIPEEYTLYAIISIGYPAESPKPRPRIPLEELVFYEEWGKKWKEKKEG